MSNSIKLIANESILVSLQVLENFSLVVKPGQTIAFVGRSGSGKSTVVHLLQRFYDATSGQVLIDDVNIQDLDLEWYRTHVGVVQQEPVLFAGTVAENIRMGKLSATQTEIELAAKLANAHDFIVELPEAYETWISEGGGSMSGGQKQRIAIARALLRNPQILMLDEATSALDTRSERVVQAALDQARFGRTVIMVAHRLTTVRDADKILVVDRGKVKETGTHEELVRLGGIYASMLKAQSTQDDETTEDSDNETSRPIPTDYVEKSDTYAEYEKRRILSEETSTFGSTVSIGSRMSIISESFDFGKRKGYAIKRMMKYSRPEWGFTVGGCIGSTIAALATPAFLLLYSEIFGVSIHIGEDRSDSSDAKNGIYLWYDGNGGCHTSHRNVYGGVFFRSCGRALNKASSGPTVPLNCPPSKCPDKVRF
ncbi:Multidrug resistance protein 1A [Paragonimus heterotremus]|uniref:Multidrug resistance protein 1A n=1 Tax=Paragonimus heterotremus TaxID=100268 RepID=A0A8J4T6U7_9TREM|nr:Multidrug resistance protein 1A [Paragonimus heterotremus]